MILTVTHGFPQVVDPFLLYAWRFTYCRQSNTISKTQPRRFLPRGTFESNWETVNEESLPSQDDILACINEMKEKTKEWLFEMDFESENMAFGWAGETRLGVVVFLLRHSVYHLGELSSLLNQSKNGEVRDHYANAL